MRASLLILSILIISFSVINTNGDTTSDFKCNGYSELCDKSYSSIAYVGTHNSYASGKYAAANQNYDIPTQLKDGVRVFLLDGHYKDDTNTTIELCHTSCGLLDSGTAVQQLKNFTTFLQNNPNEVITIFWENFDKIPARLYKAAYDAAGLTDYAYTPKSTTGWPNLSSLIEGGRRLINFIDTGADNATVPWLLSEYSYVFETPFQVSSMSNFTCTIDRPKGQSRPMYLLNHFVYNTVTIGGSEVEVPQNSSADIINSENLKNHINDCTTTFSKIPNFVVVDFYEKGQSFNVFSLVANLNGVTYVPKQLGNPSKNNGGSGSGDRLMSKSSMFALSVIITFVILGF